MNELPRKEAARAIGSLTSALELLQDRKLTISSALALLYTAVQNMDVTRPRAAVPTELANAIGLSASAMTRVMAKLEADETPLLRRTKATHDARSEAYFLSEEGRRLVAAIISRALHTAVVQELPATLDQQAYEAEPRNRTRSTKMEKTDWDEESLTLTVAPAEAVLEDEVEHFMKEFLEYLPENLGLTKKGTKLRFKSISDAVYFVMRWC